ncbi:MAG: hypothetical protein FJ308_11665 [Planctomycetes bacterium]|nr:hypothetical protein [Planctomycetota bacterium]
MLFKPSGKYREYRSYFRHTRGFSQIEVAASTALMSVLMIATMASIAASRRRATAEMNRLQGQLLATELLTEIMSLPACDPQSGPPATLGRESGETNGSIRTNWDDVDDYHNVTESPPKSRSGTDIPGFPGWTRSTVIERLRSADWTQTNASYASVYRITVSLSRNNQTITTVTAFKNGDTRTVGPLQGP